MFDVSAYALDAIDGDRSSIEVITKIANREFFVLVLVIKFVKLIHLLNDFESVMISCYTKIII